MSLTIPQASQQGLFKQGYNSYDAEDGAVIRNVCPVPTYSQKRCTDRLPRLMLAERLRRRCRLRLVHMAEIRSSLTTSQK
jgi:hypothetical protein